MHFLADENFPRLAVRALLQRGHNLADVALEGSGISDVEVFAWAVRESRLLLTMDKDFGDISRTTVASSSCGVVLFRLKASSFIEPDALAELIVARQDWARYLSVVNANGVRRRPLLLRPN